jgi:hypothetical protein
MTEQSVFYDRGGQSREAMMGAFDWRRRMGWAVQRGFGPVERTIQIGDTCYRRTGAARWRKTRADDVGGTCSAALFSNPADELDLIEQVAEPEAVGRERVRAAETTHYRATLNIGAVQGPLDLWVDEGGVVRRSRQRGEERDSFVTTREYYDLGVDVKVAPPRGHG